MPPPKPQKDRMKLAMSREDKTTTGWFRHPVRGAPVPLSRPVLSISDHVGSSDFAAAELRRFGPDDQWIRPGASFDYNVIPPMRSLLPMGPEASAGCMQVVQSEFSDDLMRRALPESPVGLAPCYRPRDFSGTMSPQETSLQAVSQLPSYRRNCYRGPPSTRFAPYPRLHRVADQRGVGPE